MSLEYGTLRRSPTFLASGQSLSPKHLLVSGDIQYGFRRLIEGTDLN